MLEKYPDPTLRKKDEPGPAFQLRHGTDLLVNPTPKIIPDPDI